MRICIEAAHLGAFGNPPSTSSSGIGDVEVWRGSGIREPDSEISESRGSGGTGGVIGGVEIKIV
jgi:hypothetical protein